MALRPLCCVTPQLRSSVSKHGRLAGSVPLVSLYTNTVEILFSTEMALTIDNIDIDELITAAGGLGTIVEGL